MPEARWHPAIKQPVSYSPADRVCPVGLSLLGGPGFIAFFIVNTAFVFTGYLHITQCLCSTFFRSEIAKQCELFHHGKIMRSVVFLFIFLVIFGFLVECSKKSCALFGGGVHKRFAVCLFAGIAQLIN